MPNVSFVVQVPPPRVRMPAYVPGRGLRAVWGNVPDRALTRKTLRVQQRRAVRRRAARFDAIMAQKFGGTT